MPATAEEIISKYDASKDLEEQYIRNSPDASFNDEDIELRGTKILSVCNAVESIASGDYDVFCSGPQWKRARGSFSTELPKEGSNDEMQSEVSNPPDVLGGDHGACGEITSGCSPTTFVDGNLIDVEQTECKEETASITSAVLEIPKHIRPNGIRKITFRFNKKKNDYGKELSIPVEPITDDLYYRDLYRKQMGLSSAESLMANDMGYLERDDPETVEMDSSKELKEIYDPQSPFSCVSHMELKMSKNVVLNDRSMNVTKLFSTRILEGARVKYVSPSGQKEIPGIIKDCGYLCGCGICNFSKVVNAHEFEVHAGIRTRNPNDHIYLENGNPMSRIDHELRIAPLDSVDGVIKSVVGSSLNEECFHLWRANYLNCKASSDFMHQNYASSWGYPHIGRINQKSYVEVPVERKLLTKNQRRDFSKTFSGRKKSTESGNKKRDNDLHKLLFMPDGLPDGTSLAYFSKGKRILGGYKRGSGILCSCCNKEISPSQFEAHAGWAAKRQPYRHIYTSSGLTLHDIALMLASGQSAMSSGSDDMCTVCGGVGELITCNSCPRAFHSACIGLQSPPSVGWHCSYCRDKSTSCWKASGETRPFVIRPTRVVKAPDFEPGGCIICRSQDFSAADFDDRTVIICDQCEKEFHVGCLRESGICDLKELPEDKWFCSDDCDKIFETLRYMTSAGQVGIPASVLTALNKKQAALGINGSRNEIKWCILSGKSRSPEHLLLLTRAAAIFRERFDPIIAKSGRDLIPIMVYGRNISGQEFSGMYCVVLSANSFIVSAALLRIFGREVAELPLVATTRENQGKGYFRTIFSCIEGLLSSMRVKHLVLPAAGEAEPMWVNKLGFRKTSHEQMLKYTRDYQLTMFKGTSLLEKEIHDAGD